MRPKPASILSGGMYRKTPSICSLNFSATYIPQVSVSPLLRHLSNHPRFSPSLSELVFLSVLLSKYVLHFFLLLSSHNYCLNSGSHHFMPGLLAQDQYNLYVTMRIILIIFKLDYETTMLKKEKESMNSHGP